MKEKIKKLINELKQRNIINNISNEEKLNNLKEGDGIYIGFDPTATSLHLGNYFQITILKRFEQIGLKPYALLGGATGMIGDPSFKKLERPLLDKEVLIKNKEAICDQLIKFGFEVIDNYNFYKNLNILDFLREVGKEININYMLSKESIATRLNDGLSFTEFAYTLLQGYDFYKLYKDFNIKIQAGGSDQWGNITTGLELIRKKISQDNDAIGITINLLTDKDGNKFGKSVNGAIWIDKELVSPFGLYQFLLNQDDSDVEKLLKWYTFLPLEEIDKIMFYHNQQKNKKLAQKMLALCVTKDIHGTAESNKAKEISEILFEQKKEIQSIEVDWIEQIKNDLPFFDNQNRKIKLLDLLVECKAASSKREAKEFILQGAISIDNEIIKDIDYEPFPRYFNFKYLIIKKGKRNFYIIKF